MCYMQQFIYFTIFSANHETNITNKSVVCFCYNFFLVLCMLNAVKNSIQGLTCEYSSDRVEKLRIVLAFIISFYVKYLIQIFFFFF